MTNIKVMIGKRRGSNELNSTKAINVTAQPHCFPKNPIQPKPNCRNYPNLFNRSDIIEETPSGYLHAKVITSKGAISDRSPTSQGKNLKNKIISNSSKANDYIRTWFHE